MQSNAMKKCAVGAMLFGGSLGLSQAASAGTVNFVDGPVGAGTYAEVSSLWIQGLFSAATPSGYTGGHGLGSFVTATGGEARNSPGQSYVGQPTTTIDATVLTNTSFGQAIELQSTRSGVLTAAQYSYASIYLSRVFSVTGGSVDWTGSLANNGMSDFAPWTNGYQIWQLDANGEIFYNDVTEEFEGNVFYASGGGSGTFGGNLAEGNYVLLVVGYVNDGTQSIATFAAVPAPGAIALLGAAGFVGTRRRR